MNDWSDIITKLGNLRDALDNADKTPVGDIDERLYAMANQTDEIIEAVENLRASYGEKP